MANTVKVKLVKGLIGTRETHRATVRGLGLRRVNSVSELEDTPAAVSYTHLTLPTKA